MARKEIVRRRTAVVVPVASGPPVRPAVGRIVSKIPFLIYILSLFYRRTFLLRVSEAVPRSTRLSAPLTLEELPARPQTGHVSGTRNRVSFGLGSEFRDN